MTSKQRVKQAIAHVEPDCVPLDYMANPAIDGRLKEHFGLSPDDKEGLLKALGIDFRHLRPAYQGPSHRGLPDRQIDMWGIRTRWVEHDSGGYWDYCDFPLCDATVEEVDAWMLPDPDQFDYAALSAACRCHKDYAIVYGGPGVGDLINKSGMLRGMEQVMIGLALDEPAQLRLMDRKIEIDVAILERALEAARDGIDLVWMGEDLGTQRGPIISPALFRKHLRPRLQKIVDCAQAHDVPVMIHSCGSSSWAFDDFVEMGIRVVDTLQPEAENMASAYLKQAFGDRLAFHGMISTAGPVANGTVQEVVQTVHDTLDIMMHGGGYCLAPTHQLQDNSPTENVVAMYESARKFGQYK